MSLRGRSYDTGYQAGRDQCASHHAHTIAPEKLAASISVGVLSSDHRQVAQVTADVRRKLLHGGISPLRLLAECHQNDVVQVASEARFLGLLVTDHSLYFVRMGADSIR